MNRKKLGLFFLLPLFILMSNQDVFGQNGKALFDKACIVCHTIGGGKTIGPDLIGVGAKRDKEWLMSFIKSSQSLIKSGDAEATAIFEEFMKIPMPDQNFTDAEISQILEYINSSEGVSAAKTQTPKIIGNPEIGRDLFIGEHAFENKGASCISCHAVNHEAAFYAGSFAKDLSESYNTLQKAGIESVLQYLSFPAMSDTYKDHPLTPNEIADLSAFLEDVSKENSSEQIAGFGSGFLLYGILAFILLLAIIEVFWRNKKPNSVKQHLL